MLVGTATTGAGVRPPTTLASAPFHAGDHHHRVGHGQFVDLGQQAVQARHPAVDQEGWA